MTSRWITVTTTLIFIIVVGCATIEESDELIQLKNGSYFIPDDFSVEDIKLRKNEIPKNYEFTNKLFTYSIQVRMFYDEPHLFGSSLSNISKQYQSIVGKKERGSILYFKFDKDFSNSDRERVKSNFYGPERRLSAHHPEEIYINNNILIIWAFRPNSEIKKISQEKVIRYFMQAKKEKKYGWTVDNHEREIGQYYNPAYGRIKFKIPKSWKSECRKLSTEKVETIIFEPRSGKSFKLMIDPLCDTKTKLISKNKEIIRGQVKKLGNKIISSAVEKELIIKDLVGNEAVGFYFSLTDKAPKPGEWRCLTQGRIGIGEYILHFTLFTQSLSDDAIKDAFEMLVATKYIKK